MKENSSLQNLLIGQDGEAGADIPVLSNEAWVMCVFPISSLLGSSNWILVKLHSLALYFYDITVLSPDRRVGCFSMAHEYPVLLVYGFQKCMQGKAWPLTVLIPRTWCWSCQAPLYLYPSRLLMQFNFQTCNTDCGKTKTSHILASLYLRIAEYLLVHMLLTWLLQKLLPSAVLPPPGHQHCILLGKG